MLTYELQLSEYFGGYHDYIVNHKDISIPNAVRSSFEGNIRPQWIKDLFICITVIPHTCPEMQGCCSATRG